MYGNTDKNGDGVAYWLLQNASGVLYHTEGDTIKQSDTSVNDSDKALTVPAAQEWIVRSIRVKLVSDGNAGNRQICIEFRDDSDVIVYSVRAGAVQAASLTRYYHFANGAADLTSFRDTDYLSNSMPEIHLPAGYDIRVYDKAAVAAATDDMDVHVMVDMRPTA